jgi:hypothetical protein
MSRSILQSMARIRPALARGVVTCALVALPVGAAAITAQARTAGATSAIRNQAALRYAVRFEGVGAEGVDDIWRGRLGGGTSGEITLRVEYRGAPMGVAEPKWPVRVMAFVAADDPSKSFLAESDGTLDWTAGAMQLEGRVSAGWMKGASVEQTLRLDRAQLDGAGSLRLEVVTASR